MATHRFAAMGTRFTFLVGACGAAPHVCADAEAVVHRLEATLSRFLPDSELSTLNRSGRAHVSADTRLLTQLALDARAATGGRFDPTLGTAVASAGYDRTFDELAADVGPTQPPREVVRAVSIGDDGVITLGHDVALDLGGIAKGFAAEMAAEVLMDAGPCLVNAGGDIATRGAPAPEGWPIGVTVADGELTIGLTGGAMATSGRDKRTWRSQGRARHHIIDPMTLLPSESDILRITVLADNAVTAETFATALFVAGAEQAVDEAAALGLAAIVVTDDGRTLMTGVEA